MSGRQMMSFYFAAAWTLNWKISFVSMLSRSMVESAEVFPEMIMVFHFLSCEIWKRFIEFLNIHMTSTNDA